MKCIVLLFSFLINHATVNCHRSITGKIANSLFATANAITNDLILPSNITSDCRIRVVGKDCIMNNLDLDDAQFFNTELAVQNILNSAAVENFAISSPIYPMLTNGPSKSRCPSRNGLFPVPYEANKYYECLGGTLYVRQCANDHVFDQEFQICRPERKKPNIPRTMKKTITNTLKSFFNKMKQMIGFKIRQPSSEQTTRSTIDIRQIVPNNDWFCSNDLKLHELNQSTVDGCLSEARNLGASFVSLEHEWCGYSRHLTLFPRRSVCSSSSRLVISLKLVDSLKKIIVKGYEYHFELVHSSSLYWTPVGIEAGQTFPEISQCVKACQAIGGDFASYSPSECHCGYTSKNKDFPSYSDGSLNKSKKFWLTIKLHQSNSSSLDCRRESNKKVDAHHLLTDTVDACNNRNSLRSDITNFSCSNKSNNLVQFSKSLCEMNLAIPQSEITTKILDRHKSTTFNSTSRHEYSFRWLSLQSPFVQWSVLEDADSLEQCLIICRKRFISIGRERCNCGSIFNDADEENHEQWMEKQPFIDPRLDEGYIFLDKTKNKAPEAWGCVVQPDKWNKVEAGKFADCFSACQQTKSTHIAFGRGSCRCGIIGDAELSLPPLDIKECSQENKNGYVQNSLLDLSRWLSIQMKLAAKGYEVHWISSLAPLRAIVWEKQYGRNVFEDCISACEDIPKTKFIALGVDGCLCGKYRSAVIFRASRESSLIRTLSNVRNDRYMQNVIAIRATQSKGYIHGQNEWVIDLNKTTTEKIEGEPLQNPIREIKQKRRERIRRRKVFRTVVKSSDEVVELLSRNDDEQTLTRNKTDLTLNGITLTTSDQLQESRRYDAASSNQAVSDVLEDKWVVTNFDKELNSTIQTEHAQASVSNGLEVKVGKRTDIEMDRESVFEEQSKNYRRINVIGMEVEGTNEFYNLSNTEYWKHENIKQSNILVDILDSNDTHFTSERSLQRIGKYKMKSKNINLEKNQEVIRVNQPPVGECYDGERDWINWTKAISISDSPLRCVLACLQRNKVHAIFDRARGCLCVDSGQHLGEPTKDTSTTGQCPRPGQWAVFSILNRVYSTGHRIAKNNIRGLMSLNGGAITLSTEKFISQENLISNKIISQLQSTHVDGMETTTKTRLERSQFKHGRVKQQLKSVLEQGMYRGELRIRLSVDQQVDVADEVHLNIEHHRTEQHADRKEIMIEPALTTNMFKHNVHLNRLQSQRYSYNN